MKFFIIASVLFVSCSASYLGALSSQYSVRDALGQYTYGYAEPNSQKTETRSANGVTHGAYSYVDANGILQSVNYVADPVHGFRVSATNLPKGPAPVSAPIAYAAPWAYTAPAVIHNGVPVETPEVQLAKAEHFAAHARAKAGLHHVHKRSAGWAYAAPWAYATPLTHNGVPVDTLEVQKAKAEHFAAYAKAGHPIAYTHYGYAAIGADGRPLETPEVQQRKLEHFAAHAAARTGHPIAVHNGAPLETPEVQHAKAAHFAAVEEAKAKILAAPVYAEHASARYYGPIHVPVIQNGVPVEPVEVQQAKAKHLAAVQEAKVKSSSAPIAIHAEHAALRYHGAQHIPVIHNGVPVETPEVQHAKAAHLVALAEAKSRSHYDGHWEDDGSYRHYAHWDDGRYYH